MGLKNGKTVRKTSLNTEVMEVGVTSVEALLSNLRETGKLEQYKSLLP